MSSPSSFALDEATPADLDDMMTILLRGWADDGMWKPMTRAVAPDDLRAYVTAYFGKRFRLPGFPFVVVRERESG